MLWTVALPIGILVYNSDHFCVGWARSKHSLHKNATVSIYEVFPARCVKVQQQKMVWTTLSVAKKLEISIAWPPKMDKCYCLSSDFVLSKFITHLSSLLLLSNLCIHHILGTWSQPVINTQADFCKPAAIAADRFFSQYALHSAACSMLFASRPKMSYSRLHLMRLFAESRLCLAYETAFAQDKSYTLQ